MFTIATVKRNDLKMEKSLTLIQKDELTKKVIELILKGNSRSRCLEVIPNHTPVKLSNEEIVNVFEHAVKTIPEQVELNVNIIGDVHIGWYEKIYAYFLKIGNVAGANKALIAKEKLLGMHKTDVTLTKNKKTVITINHEREYDTSRLTPEQKARFEFLLKKAGN